MRCVTESKQGAGKSMFKGVLHMGEPIASLLTRRQISTTQQFPKEDSHCKASGLILGSAADA